MKYVVSLTHMHENQPINGKKEEKQNNIKFLSMLAKTKASKASNSLIQMNKLI
jgi:hypothetical protein